MTSNDEESLAEWLLQWEELFEKGQDTPAHQLCKTSPHLAVELAHRMQALKATAWLDEPIDIDEPPALSTCSSSTEPRTLNNRYRLDRLIGVGGFALVWKGYDLQLQRTVAVKFQKPTQQGSRNDFIAEARRVARLKHPGIVPVHDVGDEGDACFIVSEFMECGSLADNLVKNLPSQKQAIRWIADIADALEYAHGHGVVHRDIKPANILINHHRRALLGDFGIAHSAQNTGQFSPSIGTLSYMSPEQLEGKEVDPRADIFSLGIVLHEAISGKLPYSSSDPNVVRCEIIAGISRGVSDGLPSEIKRICQKALQRDSEKRYLSAAELALDLRHFLIQPRSVWRSLAMTFLILLVGISSGGLFTYWQTSPSTFPHQGSEVVPANQLRYWLNTTTGLRHNQRCPHFHKTKDGRRCGPNDGKPCKVCGG